MYSLDSLQFSRIGKDAQNAHKRTCRSMEAFSDTSRHPDYKATQGPRIMVPKTPQVPPPLIISHKQEFNLEKEVREETGWVALENAQSAGNSILGTPKSVKEQKNYFRAFIKPKNVHRSLNRKEELLPYTNSKIIIYRQYPLVYIPTHQASSFQSDHQSGIPGSKLIELRYQKPPAQKSVRGSRSVSSLDTPHEKTIKHTKVDSKREAIRSKKGKPIIMKDSFETNSTPTLVEKAVNCPETDMTQQEHVCELKPFETSSDINEQKPKANLPSLAPPQPLSHSKSRTTQFVRPKVSDKETTLPQRKGTKTSVILSKTNDAPLSEDLGPETKATPKLARSQNSFQTEEDGKIQTKSSGSAHQMVREKSWPKKKGGSVKEKAVTAPSTPEQRKSNVILEKVVHDAPKPIFKKQDAIPKLAEIRGTDKRKVHGANHDPSPDSRPPKAALPKIKPPSKVTSLIRKANEENAIITEILEGGATSDSFLTSLLKRMNLVDEESKHRINGLISPLFTAKKLIFPKDIGARLKGMGNLRDITDREIEYIKRVFELVNASGVTEDEFCVVVALAERMTMMSMNIRLSFYDTDFAKLENQIKQFRSLFTVFAQDEGVMTYEDLRILLLSTGVTETQIDEIANLLNFKDALPGSPVKFLDFLTYIPFFTQLHQCIVDDPFGNRGAITLLLKPV